MKILSTEEAPLRVLRAAGDAHFRSNGSFEPLFRASAIAAMGLSTGAPQRSRGKAQGFGRPPGSRRLKTVCAFRYAAAPGAQGSSRGRCRVLPNFRSAEAFVSPFRRSLTPAML